MKVLPMYDFKLSFSKATELYILLIPLHFEFQTFVWILLLNFVRKNPLLKIILQFDIVNAELQKCEICENKQLYIFGYFSGRCVQLLALSLK